jgi:hypothetical protein
MSIQKPSICRNVIVHANDNSQFAGVYDSSQPMAGIITAVHADGTIGVTVFPAGQAPIALYSISHEEAKEAGQPYWSWPVIEKKEVANVSHKELDKSIATIESKSDAQADGIKAVLDFGSKATDRAPSDDEQGEGKFPTKVDPPKEEKKKPAKGAKEKK